MITLPSSGKQDETIAFLSRPESYGMRDGVVERVESHCSIVFLAGAHAFKLKRAIRYVSLDYTTRELRRAACEAEVRLNRRTAPDLYLGVRSIARLPTGRLALNGAGPALDYVVHMRRFAQSDLFEAMADQGRLSPKLMRTLGATVGRFHRDTQITLDHGGSDAIRRVIAANSRELACVAAELDGADVASLIAATEAERDAITPLLDRRRAQGKVRRCHGDLRLANICLYDGRPTLFDCIEFSDDIGCIDVLYDLAFLLMDLELKGRPDFANAVFNACLDVSPETDGLRALPLFLALRAATRSYALAGAAGRRSDPAKVVGLRAFAHRHIEAGLRFLGHAAPVLTLVDTCGGREPDWTASLAASVMPRPGARLLPLSQCHADRWRGAEETLCAGCAVVIAGCFTPEWEREAAALSARTGVKLLAMCRDGACGQRHGTLWHFVTSEVEALRIVAGAASARPPAPRPATADAA